MSSNINNHSIVNNEDNEINLYMSGLIKLDVYINQIY